MKKISSDPPNLGRSQKNLPIQLIWDGSEENFRLITSYAEARSPFKLSIFSKDLASKNKSVSLYFCWTSGERGRSHGDLSASSFLLCCSRKSVNRCLEIARKFV